MLRLALATLAALVIGSSLQWAEAQERVTPVWELTVENDRWGKGTDRHFTAGSRFSRSSSATPQWARRIMAPLRCLACTAPRVFQVEFGQEIYTPENTRTSALVVDDRPYAGWAYGALTVVGDRDAGGRRTAINEMTVELGVIGPASLADRTQSLIHRERELTPAQGWRHQLENDVGVVAIYKRGMRTQLGRDGGPFRHDATPYFEGALGDVRAYVGGGITWRSGRNLASTTVTSPATGWRIIADFNARIVMRNELLGGNIETGSYYEVAKEPVVLSATTGFEYQASRFSMRFIRERRSPEFVGQRGSDEYGAFSFSFHPQ